MVAGIEAHIGDLDAGSEEDASDDVPVDEDAEADEDAAAPDAAPAVDAAAQVIPPWTLAPMKMIAVGRPTAASTGKASMLVNDTYFDGGFWDVSASSSPWVAIDLGSGPARIMVQLYTVSADTAPAAYRLETSANSSNGVDGDWRAGVTITGNKQNSRVHVLQFSGQRWIRLTVTGANATSGKVQLNEIGVRDATEGTSDAWVFLGDSITATTYHPGPNAFAGLVHKTHPDYYPVMVNLGIGGTNSNDGVATLAGRMADFAEVQNWVVGYGTNDSASTDARFVNQYVSNMRDIITRLQKAGKNVYVPRIPFRKGDTRNEPYNAALDKLVAELGVFKGPDFYAYFMAHPEAFADDVHPNGAGSAAMNRMWADAVSALYK